MKGKTGKTQEGKLHKSGRSNTVPKRAQATWFPVDLKIQACVAALTTNVDHPTSYDAVNAARAVLNAPIAHTTLIDWLAQYKDQVRALMPTQPTTQELVTQQYNATIQQWSEVERVSLDHLVNSGKIDESSARDAAVVAGIARTHLAKMISLDSALVDSVAKMQAVCQRLGLDVKAMIDDYTTVLERRALPSVSVNQVSLEIEPDTTTD